jgi:hypothetical protein
MKALGIMSVRGAPGEWAMASLEDVRGTNAHDGGLTVGQIGKM